jgi:hypothetical protein
MFAEIEEALISALQRNLKGVKKGDIGSLRVSPKSGLPYVQVTNRSFSTADSVFGSSVEPDDTLTDAFSGDNETRLFKLSEPPVRPLASVEVNGSRVSHTAYEVDYREATILFRAPPGEGESNVKVSYRRPFEARGLKLRLVYQVTSWGKDERQRDGLAEEVMMAFLREEDELNKQGIYLTLLEGRNVEAESVEALGKCVEYSAEADLTVKIQVGRIEEIDVKRPRRIG